MGHISRYSHVSIDLTAGQRSIWVSCKALNFLRCITMKCCSLDLIDKIKLVHRSFYLKFVISNWKKLKAYVECNTSGSFTLCYPYFVILRELFPENNESVSILPHFAYLTNRQSIIIDVSETSRFRKRGGSQSNVNYIYIYIKRRDENLMYPVMPDMFGP